MKHISEFLKKYKDGGLDKGTKKMLDITPGKGVKAKALKVRKAGGETKFAALRGKNETKLRGYETYKISKK